MKSFILFCDFLGYQPNLYINKKKRFRTLLTGFLSILVGLVGLACAGYFGSDLVFKNTPTIIKTTGANDDFGPYNFSSTGFNVMIAMERQNFSYFVDPTVFYVTASMTYIRNVLSNTTGKIEQIVTIEPVPIDLCSKYYTQDDIKEKNMVFPLDLYYCPEPGAGSMSGYWGKNLYASFRIQFNKCVNTTENKNHCKTPDEISKTIQGSYVAYEMTKYQIDQTNFTNPFKRIFSDNYNIINTDLSLEYVFRFESLSLNSDDALLFRSSNVYPALDHEEKIFYRMSKTNTFASFNFQGTNGATVYLRSYIKIQTVVTQIGGFINFVNLFGLIISSLVGKSYFYFFYFDSIFSNLNDSKNNEEVKNASINSVSNSNNIGMKQLERIFKNNNSYVGEEFRVNSIAVNNRSKNYWHLKKNLPKKNACRLLYYLTDSIILCKSRSISFKLRDSLDSIFRHYISVENILKTFLKEEHLTKNLKAEIQYSKDNLRNDLEKKIELEFLNCLVI